MFKKAILAVVPMLLATGIVRAGDDDLLSAIAKLDNTSLSQADNAKPNEDNLGKSDVEALMGESQSNGEEAIAACFRKIGYGQSYGSYNNYSYNNSYSYNNCYPYSNWYTSYTPSYQCYTPSYQCYTSSYQCYTPVTYTYQTASTPCYTPCYTNYWGCW